MAASNVSALWDAEYRSGRYRSESPIAFTAHIVEAVRLAGLAKGSGLYVGCGNGRNYIPLVSAGLDLIGLDISQTALAQIADRGIVPRHCLIHGTIDDLPPGETFDVVIAIQVLQHGNRSASNELFRKALARVAPGGVFCLRVNAARTEVYFAHDVTERFPDGSFTVRYREGPKKGLDIHFFSADEIGSLLESDFEPVMPMRIDATRRESPAAGQWLQWEGIWRRLHSAPRTCDSGY